MQPHLDDHERSEGGRESRDAKGWKTGGGWEKSGQKQRVENGRLGHPEGELLALALYLVHLLMSGV